MRGFLLPGRKGEIVHDFKLWPYRMPAMPANAEQAGLTGGNEKQTALLFIRFST